MGTEVAKMGVKNTTGGARTNRKSILRRIILLLIAVVLLSAAAVFGVSEYVCSSSKARIVLEATDYGGLTDEGAAVLKNFSPDCILVFGAGIKPDGTPNHMLEDRLKLALELYRAGVSDRILLSGDHGQHKYDEVNAMRIFMEENGVPKEALFLDHAGFSTYDTVYRAKAIFQVEKAVFVTQKYHQYRALHIAKAIGIEAVAAASDQRTYVGQTYREIREIIARDKDFIKAMIKPEPRILGEAIPVSGSSAATHDQ